MGFEKSLRLLKNEGIIPEQITTDRHIQIRKHLRDQEPGIIHQFDVWHFVKNIKKKLLAASKKSSCKIIEKWIKSIGNNFWWACATCEGDAELLREKWISVLFTSKTNMNGLVVIDSQNVCIHPLPKSK